jgi:hypothetical protein
MIRVHPIVDLFFSLDLLKAQKANPDLFKAQKANPVQ